jgi:hypothetical protein
MVQTEDGMRPVLLHYHILKNGGSTIIELLAHSFWDAFAAFDLPDADAEIKPADLLSFLESHPEVRAFSSHQIFYPVPKTPGFLFFDICFLRDPIDRIRSTYDYFRIKPVPGDTFSDLANQHTLGEFARHLVEDMPWTIDNVQVNLLANGLVHDHPRGIEDLELATARMRESSFLGVVNRFDESLVAGQYLLSTVFPTLNCVQAPVNDSAKPGSTLEERLEQFRRACDDHIYSEFMRLNQMDFELLRRAREEVRRRFELVPDREVRLRELREGIASLAARRLDLDKILPVPQVAPAPRLSSKPNRKIQLTPPGTPAPGMFTRLKRRLRFVANPRALRQGSEFRRLFDADYYRQSYPDVAASGVNPFWHFITIGAFEGRNPHPLFDTNFYLSQCARPPRLDALSDYLERGDRAGLRPHPVFDPSFYLRSYPEVAKARINSLLHYVLHGAAEGRKPHPLFQPDYYLTDCPAAQDAGNPLVHFLESDPAEWPSPHPLFNCQAYLRANPDVNGNPLVHYLSRPPGSHDTPEDSLGKFDVARFSILDVEVMIVFPGPGFDACPEKEQQRMYTRLQAYAARDVFSGEITLVSQDAAGRKKYRCAPQQQAFFDCMRYDQLAMQINAQLVAG